MRDTVRIPERGDPQPGEATHKQQVPRDRTARSIKVPARSPDPTTPGPENSAETVLVFDRIVAVATEILRGGGRILTDNKKYVALDETLKNLSKELSNREYEQILINLAAIEKQQYDQRKNTEAPVVHPFAQTVITYLSIDQLATISAEVWANYLQHTTEYPENDRLAVQVLERLAIANNTILQEKRYELRTKLGPARFAAYALPVWDEDFSLAKYLADIFNDTDLPLELLDELQIRYHATKNLQALQDSVISIIDRLESLGAGTLNTLRRRYNIVNIDRYPLTQLHLLSALAAKDKATIEKLHRRDVRLILVAAHGDNNKDLKKVYQQYSQKTGSTLLFEISKPSDFYRYLLSLDDFDIHPSSIVIAARGKSSVLEFGTFSLSIGQQNNPDSETVQLSEASLQRIAREYMMTGKGRATNGKKRKTIMIASYGPTDSFGDTPDPITSSKADSTSITVRFVDEVSTVTRPQKKLTKSNRAIHSETIASTDTEEVVLEYHQTVVATPHPLDT